jgi:endo-1,4-beta-xylanase
MKVDPIDYPSPMRQKQRRFPSAIAWRIAGLFLAAACSSPAPNNTPASSGGQGVATGGYTSASGGSPSSGGALATGGQLATGGVATGGSATSTGGSGGQVATGGTASGGTQATGGSSSGGSVSLGGRSSGGATGSGGVSVASGGTVSSGGVAAGGATATGGAQATGGSSSTGGAAAGGTVSAGGAGAGGAGGGTACDVPKNIQWSSTAPIISPVGDASHPLSAVKDPTVVRYNNLWHVFGSTVTAAGVYSMFYTSFANWTDAPSAKLTFLDQTPELSGYTAAPQVFYFSPQKKWYLVYQSGPPMYSTNSDVASAKGWTAPKAFYSSTPAVLNNGWLDFWVICDAQNCHMFFSDDHGRFYKSKTTLGSFPSGFGDPVIVMQDSDAGRLFEASNVYKVDGIDKYLALIEAYDSTSNWRRYFRSWTATSLEGPWTVLHDTAAAPFAGNKNVAFDGTAWTTDISHGDAVRSSYDETMKIDACHLQFLYQGFDPNADTSNYNSIPWKLGLLTAK